MNDIDTAAIRAAVQMQAASPVLMLRESALALCDALDAARRQVAQLTTDKAFVEQYRDQAFGSLEMSERRANAAEARIAAALTRLRGVDSSAANDARRALTGGTT